MASHYRVKEALSINSSCSVDLVQSSSSPDLLVIRKVDTSSFSSSEKSQLLQDAQAFLQLRHPNLLTVHEVYMSVKGKLCIVTEYAAGGSLASRLAAQKGVYISEEIIVRLFLQISLGLKYLHENHRVCENLNSKKVFFTSDSEVKINYSSINDRQKMLRRCMSLTPSFGTISPEEIQGSPCSSQTDMWAFGVLLYEMCELRPSFEGSSLAATGKAIETASYRPISSHYSQGLRDLVAQLLSKEPGQRPSIQTVLSNALVQRYVQNLPIEESVPNAPGKEQPKRSKTARVVPEHTAATLPPDPILIDIQAAIARVQSAAFRSDFSKLHIVPASNGEISNLVIYSSPTSRLFYLLHRDRSTEKPVILKQFQTSEAVLYREMLLHRIAAERIPQGVVLFKAQHTVAGKPGFLMEVCFQGNLLQRKKTKQWCESELLRLMYRMLTTVQQLHQLNIVHQNLQAENWLVGADECVKLTDFGNAELLPSHTSLELDAQATQPSLTEDRLLPDLKGLGSCFFTLIMPENSIASGSNWEAALRQRCTELRYSQVIAKWTTALLYARTNLQELITAVQAEKSRY